MNNHSRRLAILSILAGSTVAAFSPASHPTPVVHSQEMSTLSPALAGRINEAGDAWIASGKSVGVAVEISRGGKVVFARGFGRAHLGSPAPVTPDTEFRIGSCGKQFTAAAILQLVQAGKISLNDKLSVYYPNFPRGDEVTIRELLTHTSGIHNYTEPLNHLVILEMRKDYTTSEWVDHIARQKPLYDFAPGTAWHYTNSGFYLLGGIIEKVSGEPFSIYFHDHIFAPLGMSHTAVDGDSDVGPGRATGYAPAPSRWPTGKFMRATYVSMTVVGGAGSLRTSADDLIKWSNALFAGKVTDQASLDAMLTPARLNDGRLASLERFKTPPSEPTGDYGFGMRIGRFQGHREIGHGGDIFGFNAALYSYPDDDKLTIVVLANTEGGALKLEKQVAQIMLSGSYAVSPASAAAGLAGGGAAPASSPPTTRARVRR